MVRVAPHDLHLLARDLAKPQAFVPAPRDGGRQRRVSQDISRGRLFESRAPQCAGAAAASVRQQRDFHHPNLMLLAIDTRASEVSLGQQHDVERRVRIISVKWTCGVASGDVSVVFPNRYRTP